MPTYSYILIVDDEEYIAALLCDVLTEEGYRVRSVFDGASALRVIAEQPPALVLLDNMMPGLTGLEVLGKVRSAGLTTLPIIMMSAVGRVEAYIAAGATAFILKPFFLDEVLDCVVAYMPALLLHSREYGGEHHPTTDEEQRTGSESNATDDGARLTAPQAYSRSS